MGGIGSGRHGKRKNRKTLTTECYFISIAQWTKAGHIQPDCNAASDSKRTINILWTPCNFGNSRPWFECPQCQRRSGKLFATVPTRKQQWLEAIGLKCEESYICRICLGLAYPSANASRNLEKTYALQVQRLAARMAKNPPAAVKRQIAEQMALIRLKDEELRWRKLVELDRRVLKMISAVKARA